MNTCTAVITVSSPPSHTHTKNKEDMNDLEQASKQAGKLANKQTNKTRKVCKKEILHSYALCQANLLRNTASYLQSVWGCGVWGMEQSQQKTFIQWDKVNRKLFKECCTNWTQNPGCLKWTTEHSVRLWRRVQFSGSPKALYLDKHIPGFRQDLSSF